MAGDRYVVRSRQRITSVLALFLLAPISAEYLLGYDNLIGRPVAFLVDPLGNTSLVVKLAVNAALALGVAVLVLVAARRVRTQPASSAPEGASAAG